MTFLYQLQLVPIRLEMMNAESKVYEELRAHLDTFPIGYPSTKSGVEIDILKYFFTPEEALIATKLKFSWSKNLEPIAVIHERLKDTELSLSLEELETHLDNMAKKGLIHFRNDDEKGKSYANAQFIIGIYEFQVNKLTKDFIKIYFKYLTEGFGLEVFGTKIPQFRTVPVEKSINVEHNVATYDELRNVIESVEEPLILMNCVCRQAMDLYDRPCKMTDRREVCLGFGPLAHQAIELGG